MCLYPVDVYQESWRVESRLPSNYVIIPESIYHINIKVSKHCKSFIDFFFKGTESGNIIQSALINAGTAMNIHAVFVSFFLETT